ncbi:MAG: amidase family protein, partial [Thaumarchaeota archaeon]|nr:amidase family protein [Nitrososphaerota archaeon]
NFDESVSKLEGLGAKISDFSLPYMDEITPAIFAIALPETSAYHDAWLRSTRELYGKVLRSFIELGHGILATQYLKAQRLKTMITKETSRKLQDLDVVITPTAPSIAPKTDQETITIRGKEYPAFQVLSENTYPMNFLGLPAMSLPNGFSHGLPTGLQLIAAHWNETALFKVGDAFQQITDFHRKIAAV